MTDRQGEVTYLREQRENAAGKQTKNDYGLLLADTDSEYLNAMLERRGDPRRVEENQNIRIDFTAGDLEHLHRMAVEHLAAKTGISGDRWTPQQVEEQMRGNPYNTTPGPPDGPKDDTIVRDLAAAEDPNDVLAALHITAHGESMSPVDFLLRFQSSTVLARREAGENVTMNDPRVALPGQLTLLGRADD
jgi:hypothetical protein